MLDVKKAPNNLIKKRCVVFQVPSSKLHACLLAGLVSRFRPWRTWLATRYQYIYGATCLMYHLAVVLCDFFLVLLCQWMFWCNWGQCLFIMLAYSVSYADAFCPRQYNACVVMYAAALCHSNTAFKQPHRPIISAELQTCSDALWWNKDCHVEIITFSRTLTNFESVHEVTRNTLDCDQSNVYSSRDIFSSISPNQPLCSFSLYFRSASDLAK